MFVKPRYLPIQNDVSRFFTPIHVWPRGGVFGCQGRRFWSHIRYAYLLVAGVGELKLFLIFADDGFKFPNNLTQQVKG